MRITESKLRRIIRSVILESAESQNKEELAENYTSIIYFNSGTSKLEISYKENESMTKEKCFNWALDGIKILKRNGEILETEEVECLPDQINLKLERVNLDIEDDIEDIKKIAKRIALWIVDGKNRAMYTPKAYTQKMENQYKIIEKAENEIYENSIEDVQSIIEIYRKYFSDNSFKQSFVNVLKTFGYPQHAIKAALSEVGLTSTSYDDHDYSI